MRVTRNPSIHQLQPVDGDASRIGRSRGGQDRERDRQRQKERGRGRERGACSTHSDCGRGVRRHGRLLMGPHNLSKSADSGRDRAHKWGLLYLSGARQRDVHDTPVGEDDVCLVNLPIQPVDRDAYAWQILDAIGHMHSRGIVHCDLKVK